MKAKKRVAWVTPRCFVETDIYAIETLYLTFDIDWYIIDSEQCSEYSERITDLIDNGVNIINLFLPGRNRSVKVFFFYWNLLKKIKKEDYDIIYNPIFGMPYYMPLEKLLLPSSKVVIALHNVTTPKGAKASSTLSKLYTYFVSHNFLNYHTFSQSQCDILKKIAKGKNVFMIPFFLKDYGKSCASPGDTITFLFFGQILEYKRVDILIQAAERVYEKCKIPFKVKIAGSCPYWEKYDSLIAHKNLFDLTLRRITNEEIPDLFSSSHYFVMPYQDIAQSGAIIVAINYELPVVASSLPSFKEHIVNGENGFLIRPANLTDLESMMFHIIQNHSRIYPTVKEGMIKTKSEKFLDSVIMNEYINEFNKIIGKQ